MIVDNFIPPAERMKILSLAEWDEDSSSWKLKDPPKRDLTKFGLRTDSHGAGAAVRRPLSAVGARRPVSEYARKQNSRIGSAARYKVSRV